MLVSFSTVHTEIMDWYQVPGRGLASILCYGSAEYFMRTPYVCKSWCSSPSANHHCIWRAMARKCLPLMAEVLRIPPPSSSADWPVDYCEMYLNR